MLALSLFLKASKIFRSTLEMLGNLRVIRKSLMKNWESSEVFGLVNSWAVWPLTTISGVPGMIRAVPGVFRVYRRPWWNVWAWAHYKFPIVNFFGPRGGGGTPLCNLYRYVRGQRVFLVWNRVQILTILVWNRVGFVHSDMESGMVLTRSYLFINFLLQRTEVWLTLGIWSPTQMFTQTK